MYTAVYLNYLINRNIIIICLKVFLTWPLLHFDSDFAVLSVNQSNTLLRDTDVPFTKNISHKQQ